MTENDTRLHKGGPPEGNTNAQTHGIHTFERKGPDALNPFEVDSLQELRALARTHEGRQAIREELLARLVIIDRKFFVDMQSKWNDPRFWDSGVITRGGTYLAETRRLLDTFPDKEDPNVIDAMDIVKQYREDVGQEVQGNQERQERQQRQEGQDDTQDS
jgi:hypothetical protein